MSRILAISLLITSTACAQDDRPDRRVRDPALQKSINEGIHKGISYLLDVQNEDGSWTYDKDAGPRRSGGDARLDGTGGLTALALYALSASGIPASHEAITRGLNWVDEHPHPFGDEAQFGVYSASLLVLALTRIDAKQYRRRIAKLATAIHEAQLKNGQWTYGLAPHKTSTKDDDRKGPARRNNAALGDNSNTQFAALALWSAQELTRFRVPKKVWKRLQAMFEGSQQKDGGWAYKLAVTTSKERDRPGRAGPGNGGRGRNERTTMVKPTMTAAGLVSYVLASASLKGGGKALDKVRKERAATKGLSAFLGRPLERAYKNYYYVYSIERVGTVLGVPDYSWYPKGAKALLKQQDSEGRFFVPAGRRGGERPGGHGDSKQVYDTTLALLFLSKATQHPITQKASRSK